VALRCLAVDGQLVVHCQDRPILACPFAVPSDGVSVVLEPLARTRIRMQARIDGFGIDRREPLATAIIADDGSTVAALVQAGRRVDQPIDGWCQPLTAAVYGGRRQAFEALIAAGADVHARHGNEAHQGVLAALNGGQAAMLHRMAALGVDVPAELARHRWWPMVLLRFHDEDAVAAAIELGLDCRDRRWLDAITTWKPPLAIVDRLAGAGLDLGWYGEILRDQPDALAERLRREPGLVKDSLTGASPLHWAVGLRRTHLIGPLLAAGAALDAGDADGDTPLHWALAWTLDLGAVQSLLAAGADPHRINTKGEDAFAMAANARFNAALPLLRAAADKRPMPKAADF
jgi:hypothetical protein